MSGAAIPRKQSPSLVEGFALFADLSASERATIVSAAREKVFSRGETLFLEGEPIRQNILLLSGCAKVTQIGISGAEVILRLNGPGELVGAFGFCGRCEHCTSAQAIQPSTAIVWEGACFDTILERFPTFRRNTNRALEERLAELEQRFREISTEKVGARVSSQLIRLSNQVGRLVDGKVEIGVSRANLAQLTGTTLFTVSRLLCQWKSLGIVSPRREAVILRDVAALKQLALGDE